MKCPYKYKKDCKHIDTSGMTKSKECSDCDWYDDGVRETGGISIGLALVDFKINKIIKDGK